MPPNALQPAPPEKNPDLDTAIREAQALEHALKEAPVPQPPLTPVEIDQLLAEAKRYGIDLSLLVRNVQLSPTERLEKLQGAVELLFELRASMPRHQHQAS